VRQGKWYRGSKQRLNRIRLRGNTSLEMWLLVVWVTFLLLLVLPWMIHQSP
jgi:competence protein ComGC